ncbi:hypothetical protein MC885_018779 [Smutsia gigantea]|nr:hypothetical protein MC885_018779 [Smutsia gigantea]
MPLGRQWHKPASRSRRHVAEEADVTVGPLIFLGKAADQSMGSSVSSLTSVMLGLGLVTGITLTLATVVLAIARRQHTASHSAMYPVSASQ